MPRKYQKVDLDGVDDLESALKRLNEDVSGVALREAVQGGAEIVVDVAQQLAPRSQDGSHGNPPGFMAEGIHAERQYTRTQDKAQTAVGWSKEGWYGQLQETGTIYEPAQPHMRPALDETKDDVVDEIRERLERSILRHVRA